MKHRIKRWVKRTLHRAGWDLHRYHATSSPSLQLVTAMRSFQIDLVFDIGANVGQFGSDLREAGFSGKIVSFEPLRQAHRELTQRSQGDEDWLVHPRCAIGASDGETVINVAGNSVSSSVLPMLEAHEQAAQASQYVGEEKVPLFALDSVAPGYLSDASRCVLKIDTQGYEAEVLNGAEEILPQVRGVLCELSLVPLYQDQVLWKDMMKRLEAAGFALWFINPGFTDASNGRTLQVDAAFFREA